MPRELPAHYSRAGARLRVGPGGSELPAGIGSSEVHRSFSLAPLKPLAPPLLVGGVLAGTALVGHDLYPAGAWVPVVAGPLVAWAAHRLPRSAWEQGFVLVAGTAGSVWTAAAWAAPHAPIVWGALGVGGTLFSGLWLAHRRIRSGVEVDWPSAAEAVTDPLALVRACAKWWRDQRELRRLQEDWRWLAIGLKIRLAGSKIVGGRFDEGERRYDLDLGGWELDDLRKVSGRLESHWQTPHGAVTVGRGAHAGQAVIRVRIGARATLPEELPWPGQPVASVREPIAIGEAAGSRAVRLRLATKLGHVIGHLLVSGMTGFGKSALLQVLALNLANCDDVELLAIDPKEGVELDALHPLLAGLAVNDREATQLLRRCVADMEERYRELRRRRLKKWEATPTTPMRVLFVDETGELSDATKMLLDRLSSKGRGAGYCIVLSTQRTSAKKLGDSGDLRAHYATQAWCYVQRKGDNDLAAFEGAAATGWDTTGFTAPGRFLVHSKVLGFTVPDPVQIYLPSDEDAAALVERRLSVRPLPNRDPDGEHVAPSGSDEGGRNVVLSLAPAREARPAEPDRASVYVVPAPRNRRADLIEALKSKHPEPAETKALYEAAGVDPGSSTVHDWLDELRAEGLVEHVGRGRWRWLGDGSVHPLLVKED